MDAINADLLLQVIQYMSVRDMANLALASKRYLFLVSNYQQRLRGPQLVAVTSDVPGGSTRQQRTMPGVCREAVNQLQTQPTLALSFCTYFGNKPAAEEIPRFLPDSTVILSVSAEDIQSSGAGIVECTSHASLMLGGFPDVTSVPFHFGTYIELEDSENLMKELESHDDQFWKFVLIYVTEHQERREVQRLLDWLQGKYPHAAIVGGVCDGGHVSMPCGKNRHLDEKVLSTMTALELNSMLRRLGIVPGPGMLRKKDLVKLVYQAMHKKPMILESVDAGIFGVVLGGEVPVRSIVSQGMRSLTFDGPPQPATPFFVKEASCHVPGPSDFMFSQMGLPHYHKICRIQNADTGQLYSLTDMIQEFGVPSHVGLRNPDEDGFHLGSPGPHDSTIVFDSTDDKETLIGMNLDLFSLDGRVCMQDMDFRMKQLKESLAEEELLGAIMVSCNGRGPSPNSLIPKAMADARRFASVFPDVPCFGFYAGGEIGPRAMPGRQSVFQTGKVSFFSSSSCLLRKFGLSLICLQTDLQGFTAVFALFIVPKRHLGSIDLDDCEENVNAFVAERFNCAQE